MLENILTRPIVFFDLETTGTNIQSDRIIEISAVKISPGGERVVKTRLINPTIPIPREASDIHGIKDEDVAGKPPFKAIAQSLYLFLEGCDLGGYNSTKFDIPLLINEFKRAGLEFSLTDRNAVDVFTVFRKKERRTLAYAYQFFCGKELKGAHGAEADIMATIEVFEAQLAKYAGDEDSPLTNIESVTEFCNAKEPGWIDETGKFKWRGAEAVVGFGRYNGETLSSVATGNPGFLKWIVNNDFPADAKKIAQDALRGQMPVKEE